MLCICAPYKEHENGMNKKICHITVFNGNLKSSFNIVLQVNNQNIYHIKYDLK
jgi:hypothetical protein